MEVMSLADTWDKEARIDKEEIKEAYTETMTFWEGIEYAVKHNYDFSCFVLENKQHELYIDCGGFEYRFLFDKNDKLVEKTRHPYMD